MDNAITEALSPSPPSSSSTGGEQSAPSTSKQFESDSLPYHLAFWFQNRSISSLRSPLRLKCNERKYVSQSLIGIDSLEETAVCQKFGNLAESFT